jgi:aspartate/tyrosine/aromatic aminotransferase
MLEALGDSLPDPLLDLIRAHREDRRTSKVDVGVGVYVDANGVTPVMQAVKAAERSQVEEQTTKAYLGAEGDVAFARIFAQLALGLAVMDKSSVKALQTPGGTAALRLGCDLAAFASARARI